MISLRKHLTSTLLPIALLVIFGSNTSVNAQPIKPNPNNPYILFTGLVLTSDSLKAIPYVVIRNSQLGMLGHSDQSGYFNVIVRKGDTVDFIQIEQKPVRHIVPDTLTNSRYHVVTLMVQDTLTLPTIYIRAMPLKSLFDNTFVKQEIASDRYEIARQNLENERRKEEFKQRAPDARQNLENERRKEEFKQRAPDAGSSQNYLTQARANQLYYYKQAPPQLIFSPAAWAQFIEAWKRGDFKKKKPQKPNY